MSVKSKILVNKDESYGLASIFYFYNVSVTECDLVDGVIEMIMKQHRLQICPGIF